MKTIKMTFGKADGSKTSVSLKYAKNDLTETTVRSAMQTVIDNTALIPAVTAIVGAELVDRTVAEIIA